MSRECKLYTNLVKVEKGNREDLLMTLERLSDIDCDFNGENGVSYACDEAIENGFNSDQEYLLDKVKDIKDDVECITYFIDEWLSNDSYYSEYEFDCLTDEDGKVYVIALSVVCGY